MPRKAKELSARAVAALKEPGAYAVGGIDGLYLTVATAGARSWLFRYSVKVGDKVRRREMGLGGFPKLSLSEAREKAREAQAELNASRDPIDARNTVKRVPTFWEVAEDLLATVEASGKNAKHRQQWRNTLKDYAAPLHAKPVDSITTDDVAAVLAPIWQAKPETASRLRGRIERVLSVAKAKGHRAGENPAAWRDNLEPILGKRRRLTRGHHEALGYADVAAFVGALRRGGGVAALALEFTILTAARTGEVIGARWPEVDLAEKVWTVPAVRMKAGREHRVPLTDRAVAILAAVKKLRREGDIVFPGQSADGCLSNMAMAAVLKRMNRDDITVHGFRSCFRDWAGEVSSFPNEVCEMALAHTIRNKAEAAYRRGDLFEKRRAMMAAWAAYCEPPAGFEPLPLPEPDAAEDAPKRGRGRPPLTLEQVQDRIAAGKPLSRNAKALALAAGIPLAARRRGRRWGSGHDAVMMDEATALARRMAEAGPLDPDAPKAGAGSANRVAVAALYEVDHGVQGLAAIEDAEAALAKSDWTLGQPASRNRPPVPPACVVASNIPAPTPDQLENCQRGPDPDCGDDAGFPERWFSPAFQSDKGMSLLATAGLEIPPSRDDARGVGRDVGSIARNVSRHQEKRAKEDAEQLDLLGWSSTGLPGK